MDNLEQGAMFSTNFIIIIILLLIIVLSFFGINVLTSTGHYLEEFSNRLKPFFQSLLSTMGFGTGSALIFSSNLVAHSAITGIEIANGAIVDAGDLLKNSSKNDQKIDQKIDANKRESFIEYAPYQVNDPQSSEGADVIQNSIGARKNNWCLIGNKTSLDKCRNVSTEYVCATGQLYPSQFECLLSKSF
jgi:hypothetical protein